MRSWRSKTREGAEAAASQYIYSDRVLPGHHVRVKRITALNESNATANYVKFGIDANGTKEVIHSVAGAIAAAITTSLEVTFLLSEGERIFAYFDAPVAAGDVLYLLVLGEDEGSFRPMGPEGHHALQQGSAGPEDQHRR